MTSLDLTPLGCLTTLQMLNISNTTLTSLVCFLSSSTMKILTPIDRRQSYKFTFTPLGSIKFIIQIMHIVEKYEEPWKTHHLIQGSLALLDLEWIGVLDMEPETFARIVQDWYEPDFIERERTRFISYWLEQIESGGTTIGISLERIGDSHELVERVDRIVELRNHEMESLVLSKEHDVVDLRPLHLTAYGFQILQALEMGVTCKIEKFGSVYGALEELGFDLKMKEQAG
ncbi:MAG: hypothetical protein ACTSV2_06945 [Candidatus Thorarchaeota archaeon]